MSPSVSGPDMGCEHLKSQGSRIFSRSGLRSGCIRLFLAAEKIGNAAYNDALYIRVQLQSFEKTAAFHFNSERIAVVFTNEAGYFGFVGSDNFLARGDRTNESARGCRLLALNAGGPFSGLYYGPRSLIQRVGRSTNIRSRDEPLGCGSSAFVTMDAGGDDDVTNIDIFNSAGDANKQCQGGLEASDRSLGGDGARRVAGARFCNPYLPLSSSIFENAFIKNRAFDRRRLFYFREVRKHRGRF